MDREEGGVGMKLDDRHYTKWWQSFLLWFKPVRIGVDFLRGENCNTKVYYKRLFGRVHITKIDHGGKV